MRLSYRTDKSDEKFETVDQCLEPQKYFMSHFLSTYSVIQYSCKKINLGMNNHFLSAISCFVSSNRHFKIYCVLLTEFYYKILFTK